MSEYFGRLFKHTPEEFLSDLRSLSMEGALYAYLWIDEEAEFRQTRIALRPEEIVEYVDAQTSFEEYQRHLSLGFTSKRSLELTSNPRIASRVREYNEWARDNGGGAAYCFAAFLGPHLESLTCSVVEGRHEILGRVYSGDRRFLLDEIISALPGVVAHLSREGKSGLSKLTFDTELAIRDVLYATLRGVFPDVQLEESTERHAGSVKYVDMSIPTIESLIEIKFIKRANISKHVDELKIDIESYYKHSRCSRIVCVVWDPENLVTKRDEIVRDLGGQRVRAGKRFEVQVRYLP